MAKQQPPDFTHTGLLDRARTILIALEEQDAVPSQFVLREAIANVSEVLRAIRDGELVPADPQEPDRAAR